MRVVNGLRSISSRWLSCFHFSIMMLLRMGRFKQLARWVAWTGWQHLSFTRGEVTPRGRQGWDVGVLDLLLVGITPAFSFLCRSLLLTFSLC
jgi:hypothetical protein